MLGCKTVAVPSTMQIVLQLSVQTVGTIAMESKAWQPNFFLLGFASTELNEQEEDEFPVCHLLVEEFNIWW